MKNYHASELRGEAKQDARQRQLLALTLTGLLTAAAWNTFAQAPAQSAARDELRAAKIVEAALFARRAPAEELRKMDALYSDLIAKFPADAAVRNGRAEFLWSTGERERAIREWLAAEAIDPKNAVVLDHLGGAFLAAGEVKKSAGYYARAVENAPLDAVHHFSFAHVLFLFRHELLDSSQPNAEAVLRRSLKHFAEASRLQPQNSEYARSYAETFYSVAEPDWHAAFAAWERFLAASAQKDFAWANLARVHLKLGQKTEARACLERIQAPEYERLKTRLRQRIDTE